jgi:uncharacterized protein (DUF433 family)
MSKFESIVREPLVMGGQARIRDTGITVNEIVRLSLAGLSQTEILQKFPVLEAEDVHEALGYAMKDTLRAFADAKSEIGESITPIIQFNEIALGQVQLPPQHDKKALEDFKQKLPEMMISYGRRARADVIGLKTWLQANFEYPKPWPEPLDYLLTKGVEEAKGYNSELEFKISVNVVENILVDSRLVDILACLLGRVYDFVPQVHLSVASSNGSLVFTINRVLRENASYHEVYYESIRLKIVRLLLYQLGSELKVRQEESSVIFAFALPIVEK